MEYSKGVYLITIFLSFNLCYGATPIVMWHGMGDSCCFPFSLGNFKDFLSQQIEGVYIKSIQIGSSLTEDVENGYFMSPNRQVELVCQQLAEDDHLKDGFHGIGFSQGSQFLRAVVQRCGHKLPPMLNLISLGGQHQGVYGLPNCGSMMKEPCDYIRRLLNHAAYFNWVQNYLVQATYWHDPLNEELYRASSHFLADINNELTTNRTYIQNLSQLRHLVLVKFADDEIVQPRETEWFGFYRPGQSEHTQTLQESDIYIEDRLGLQKMDKAGKLVFLSTPGNHLQLDLKWFISNIVTPYLI